MSRWANWSTGTEAPKMGFGSFMQLTEAGQPIQGDPQQVIQQNGWQHRGYGYYVDGSGKTVARMMDGQLYSVEGQSDAQMQIDQGNPTSAASGMKPADRARSMGLQSNGRGGYRDPQTGQIVARTVNNELVFYDQGPGGGAVSDGAGGQNVAMAQPSWQDPVSGLIIVPPSKPESPAEMAAVPDPVPSQPPAGFNDFIQQAKLKAYRNDARIREIDAAQAEVDELYNSHDVMRDMKIEMDQLIQEAEESGDEYRIQMAAGIKDYMNENGEEIKGYFDTVPVEQHRELSNHVLDYVIAKVKEDYAESINLYDEVDALENNQELTPEENQRLEQLYDIGFNAPFAPKHHIENLVDAANGIEDIPEIKISATDKFQPGYLTTYVVRTTTPGSSILKPDGIDDSLRVEITDAADRVARQYGMRRPKSMAEIQWSVNDRGKQEEDDKKVALDALSTWRRNVLPSLTPGLIVFNEPDPGGREMNQRERIYKLAGFGPMSKAHEGQFGLVVQDEIGNNKVVPIDPTGESDELFDESFAALTSLNYLSEADVWASSDDTINILYETLGL